MPTLFGHVQGVIFNAGDMYVLSFEVTRTEPATLLEDHSIVGKVIKVKGLLSGLHSVRAMVPLSLIGDMVDHPKYGPQLAVQAWRPWGKTPTDIIRFLQECVPGFLEGTMAQTVVQAFGMETFKKLSHAKDEVLALFSEAGSTEQDQAIAFLMGTPVGGESRAKVAKALAAWDQVRLTCELMVLLQDQHLTTEMLTAVITRFGSDTHRIITQHPYVLMGIDGFTFSQVDGLATRLGIREDDPRRVEGAVLWALREGGSGSGHLFLPQGQISSVLADLQDRQQIGVSTYPPHIAEAVARLVEAQHVVVEPGIGVYLPVHYGFERNAAAKLAHFLGEMKLEVDVEDFLVRYQKTYSIDLSAAQIDAVHKLVKNKVQVITGLPGTGKTTLIRTLVSLFKEAGLSMLLLAPTGIAAKRLASVTGHPASTIHRALKYDGDIWGYDASTPYPVRAVIVDETSMVDQELLFRVLDAMERDTVLVFVGDDAQLPSVGPGNVLREMTLCPALSHVKLTQIFRQAEASEIVLSSHRINRGDELPLMSYDAKSQFRFIPVSDADKAADLIVQMAAKLKSRDANFQVLAPMYRGPAGVDDLNERLREALNPSKGQSDGKFGFLSLREGDRVMVIRNDYDLGVYNGDMGKLLGISPREVQVRVFGAAADGMDSIIKIPREMVSMMLKPAYAITVHKSQGCEFGTVILPVFKSQGRMLQRNLLYTAVTRARDQVWLVGQPEAVAKAIANNEVIKRHTVFSDSVVAAVAGVEGKA